MLDPIKVVLVDDHDLFREVLRMALGRRNEITVVGEAGDGITGQEVAVKMGATVVLMDIEMPLCSGIEATRELTTFHPEIKVIMLSAHQDEVNLRMALFAGAKGYLLKTTNMPFLVYAIQQVAKGESVVDPLLTKVVVETMVSGYKMPVDQIKGLTLRETYLLAHISAGESNKEIGVALDLAVYTVRNNISALYRKLGVLDRTQAVIYALRHGIAPSIKVRPKRQGES